MWSTLTYGCECWTITSDIKKKIKAAEMCFIRRMLRISCTEKKPNVNVLREGNVQRSLLKTIRKRPMESLGHVCRRRGLEFLSLAGKVEGKRDRDKQRITFLDSLCSSATGGQRKGLNFLKLSNDRVERHGRQCLFQIWHLMMMMINYRALRPERKIKTKSLTSIIVIDFLIRVWVVGYWKRFGVRRFEYSRSS